MPLLRPGDQFPNMFLVRPEGTSLEIYELWKKQHALILFSRQPHPDLTAFISHFQDNARLFEWLNLRLLAVYPAREKVPSPWPAPSHPPFVYGQPLPDGVEWDKAYLISKNRSVFGLFPEPWFMSVAGIEKDVLYWESGHCLS